MIEKNFTQLKNAKLVLSYFTCFCISNATALPLFESYVVVHPVQQQKCMNTMLKLHLQQLQIDFSSSESVQPKPNQNVGTFFKPKKHCNFQNQYLQVKLLVEAKLNKKNYHTPI